MKTNRQRCTQEQLEYYLDFMKEHPELKAAKNSLQPPRAMQNLWEQLAKDLNGIRGPTRTASQWKLTLTNWKSTIRSRARRAKAEVRMTSGEPQVIRLSRFEQQAFANGFSKLQGYNNNELPSAESMSSLSSILSVALPLPSPSESVPSKSPPPDRVPLLLPLAADIQHAPSNSRKIQENGIEQLLQIAINNMESQKIREEQILAAHMAVIASNTALQQTLEMAANSFKTLAEVIVRNLSK